MTVKPVCDYAWVREMTIGQLLDLLDPPYPRKAIGEEDWNFRRDALCLILVSACGFYDDFDSYNYDFALGVAWHVLKGDPPERVIECMATLAYHLLQTDDPGAPVHDLKDLTADTRARLERIRDTSPKFAEGR